MFSASFFNEGAGGLILADNLEGFTMNYCYTLLLNAPAGANVGIIKRNETGYYMTDYDFGTGEAAERVINALNERLGINADMRRAFEVCSMFDRWAYLSI